MNYNIQPEEVKDMMDYSVIEMTKIIVYLTKIGVQISDEQILQIADDLFAKEAKDFNSKKQEFLNSIRRIIGK